MVTAVPTGPEIGVKPVIDGTGITVKLAALGARAGGGGDRDRAGGSALWH